MNLFSKSVILALLGLFASGAVYAGQATFTDSRHGFERYTTAQTEYALPEIALRVLATHNESASQITLQSCCKICRKGKACGNSCIRRSYTCWQPPGCACDAQ